MKDVEIYFFKPVRTAISLRNRLVAAILLICVTFAAAENIKCSSKSEYVHTHFDVVYGRMSKCCHVTDTEILHDDSTFLAVEDISVDGLQIRNTDGFDLLPVSHFLPVRIYRSYPNIIGIYAGGQKLKEISKKNFQRLLKLEYLFLNNNNIQKIKSDTFEGLIKLKTVNLGEFTIKSSGKNGRVTKFKSSCRIQQNPANERNAVRWPSCSEIAVLVEKSL